MLQNDPNFQMTVKINNETWVDHFNSLVKSATSTWRHTYSPATKKFDKPNLLVRHGDICFRDKGVITACCAYKNYWEYTDVFRIILISNLK